ARRRRNGVKEPFSGLVVGHGCHRREAHHPEQPIASERSSILELAIDEPLAAITPFLRSGRSVSCSGGTEESGDWARSAAAREGMNTVDAARMHRVRAVTTSATAPIAGLRTGSFIRIMVLGS